MDEFAKLMPKPDEKPDTKAMEQLGKRNTGNGKNPVAGRFRRGTQVTVKADLNKDGIPDIIVGNKKGCFVFMSKKP